MSNDTYSNKNTVQVHWLPSRLHATEYFCQAPHVAHPQDVDVILAAECLDQGEVNLQSHIFLVVCGQ